MLNTCIIHIGRDDATAPFEWQASQPVSVWLWASWVFVSGLYLAIRECAEADTDGSLQSRGHGVKSVMHGCGDVFIKAPGLLHAIIFYPSLARLLSSARSCRKLEDAKPCHCLQAPEGWRGTPPSTSSPVTSGLLTVGRGDAWASDGDLLSPIHCTIGAWRSVRLLK